MSFCRFYRFRGPVSSPLNLLTSPPNLLISSLNLLTGPLNLLISSLNLQHQSSQPVFILLLNLLTDTAYVM
jgi:hypothetical protein